MSGVVECFEDLLLSIRLNLNLDKVAEIIPCLNRIVDEVIQIFSPTKMFNNWPVNSGTWTYRICLADSWLTGLPSFVLCSSKALKASKAAAPVRDSCASEPKCSPLVNCAGM
jgi:hypothetical protein